MFIDWMLNPRIIELDTKITLYGWKSEFIANLHCEEAKVYVINQKEHHALGTTIRILEMEES